MADIEVQGYKFDYVPRTKANIDRVREMVTGNEEKREEMYEFVEEKAQRLDPGESLNREEVEAEAKEQLGFTEVLGPWELRYEIFEMALDGPHEHIDREKLTWDVLEEVRTDFIPKPMRLLDALDAY